MLDTLLDKGRRKRMVGLLSQKLHVDKRVLEALSRVPRHQFVDSGLEHMAYRDIPLSIQGGQTISQPSTVAIQTDLLQLKPNEKVLEIGTGCGYQTAVLEILGGDVYSMERIEELHREAKENLRAIGCFGTHLFLADGFNGLPQYAPFDKILVTCAAPFIPDKLLEQLKIGGKMVIPVEKSISQDKKNNNNEANEQQMVVIEKISETKCRVNNIGDCSFVPMLQGTKE